MKQHDPFRSYLLGSTSDISGDIWMYPYQRTPIKNPYISPI